MAGVVYMQGEHGACFRARRSETCGDASAIFTCGESALPIGRSQTNLSYRHSLVRAEFSIAHCSASPPLALRVPTYACDNNIIVHASKVETALPRGNSASELDANVCCTTFLRNFCSRKTNWKKVRPQDRQSCLNRVIHGFIDKSSSPWPPQVL